MTSGTFTSFPVDQVWVDRAKRQRKELKNIPDLASSIAQNGLIHPPVIKHDGELIVGERRWTAVKSLGWTHIPVQFVEDLSPDELQAIEYEENVRRVDLTWQEQCLAVEGFHRIRSAADPLWTATRTAEALGMPASVITERRAVAREIEAGNQRVVEAPKYSTALSIVTRTAARKRDSVLANVAAVSVSSVGEAPVPVERPIPLLNEDFHEWAAAYTGIKFNFIHCDFPYGVGMHQSDQGAGALHGTYVDSPDVYWALLRTLSDNMHTVVADSAHLMFWFSMDFYQPTFNLLSDMGWKVDPFPLIWKKSDNIGILPDAKRGPRRIYETCFFASRGDRLIASPVSNAFDAPGGEKEIHMNEKPVAMLRHFMRMFVDEYSVVLDPTAGSGNALKAATGLGAPTVLGLERDPEFFQRAKEHYYAD